MKYFFCIPSRLAIPSLRQLIVGLSALLPVVVARAQTIISISHNDTYDFSSSMTNLITNPDFEQHPSGFTNQAWYAVVNTTSGCGYNVVPGWTGGPAGYECYATLALLRPSGTNLIFNDAYPALGGTGICSGPAYPTTPDMIMANSPLTAATDATTNWILYFGDWEDTKKINGLPVLNLVTGEVTPMDTALSYIADNSGSNSANLPKKVASISQTVNIAACHTYELEFHLTGEGVFGSTSGPDAFYPADGILELTIGSHLLHLMSPGTGNFHGLGSSEIYHIQFVSSSPSVTITFASPGHLQKFVAANSPAWAPYLTAPAGASGTVTGNRYHSSEVILDGVRLFDLGTVNCSLLALGLMRFDATRQSDGVQLVWNTASNAVIRSFEVQRSVDATSWASIATVAGPDANDAGSGQFSYNDIASFGEKCYYRIRVDGVSGTTQYSEVKAVPGSPDEDIRVMPNPATNKLTIAGKIGMVFGELWISDLTGKIVSRFRGLASGASISLADLPPGVYFITIHSNQQTIVKKLIKK